MADLSLDSPGAFRLVAAAAATVGSFALVALGVQIGTNGLGADGPERGPASATVAPAAAVVDLARPRTVTPPALEDSLAALVPVSGVSVAGGGGAGAGSGLGGATTASGSGAGSGGASPGGDGSAAPADPAVPPVPVPVPAPAPLPTTPTLPGPTPTVPDPGTVLDPLTPLVAGLAGTGGSSSESGAGPGSGGAPAGGASLLETLTGLLGL